MPNFETNIDHFNFLRPISPQKEATATKKEWTNLLMEVQAKLYYGLKAMASKFRKYGQLENITVHLKNTPTYIKYQKEEDKIKALKEWQGL